MCWKGVGSLLFFLFSFALCVCPAKSKGMDRGKMWRGNMVWRGVRGADETRRGISERKGSISGCE